MIDQVKYFTKLSSTAVLTLVKLYVVAMLSTAVSFFVCFMSLFIEPVGAAPHAGAESTLLVLLETRPWQCVFCALIVACGFLLVVLSGKYTMSKVINRLVSDKSENTVLPLLNKVIEKFRQKRPAILEQASAASRSKLNLIQEVKNEIQNRWVKRAVVFALKKARLDDVDFSQEDTRLSEVIRDRTMMALREMSQPDKPLFWITIAFQWVLVVAAYLID